MCIPLVGQIALTGWISLIVRRAAANQDTPLPRLDFDFNYLGELLNVGFKAFIARFLWTLPMMAVMGIFYCCLNIAFVGLGAGIGAVGSQGGQEAMGAAGGIGMLCMGTVFPILMAVFVMAAMMPLHVATMKVEITGDLNAAMRFKEVLDTTKLLSKELIVGGFMMGLIAMGFAFVSMLTVVLYIPAMVVIMVIMGYWYGELYRVYLAKGGEPWQIAELAVGGDVPPPSAPGAPGNEGWGQGGGAPQPPIQF